MRDFTCDEDRCRACVRHLPRNLACLTHLAIAIVRCNGRFRYLPEANRYYAARAQEVLDAILSAPIARSPGRHRTNEAPERTVAPPRPRGADPPSSGVERRVGAEESHRSGVVAPLAPALTLEP